MGRDKAFLPCEGEALASRTARIACAAAGTVVLIGDPARHAVFGYPVVADRYPGEGPLGGIVTALRDTAAEFNLVVACDMPRLTLEFLDELLTAAEAEPVEILVPTTGDGRLEPLCAVYRQSARAGLERAFDAGLRKVTAAFAGLVVRRFPVQEVACFQNLNTPEDWARYAAG
jgi:molybdopterin-guanine dinucleotide biosynthesis protein A